MRIISRLFKELQPSQERLSSMELVSWPVIWFGWLVSRFARSFAGQSVSQRSRVGADLRTSDN